jgi:hypothetical protein
MARLSSKGGGVSSRPNYSIRFINPDGEVIGELNFNGWVMTFDGNAEESAIKFFHLVSQMFSRRLDEEYQRGLTEGKK